MITSKMITKQIVIPATVSEVWEKWTTEKGIKSFFAQECKVELQIGGAFEMYFLKDNPPGLKGSEGCKVLSFLPEKMLSFSWNAPPQYLEVRNSGHYTWVVLEFEAISSANTLLKLYHYGWREGGEWDNVFLYFVEAWDIVLNRLLQS